MIDILFRILVVIIPLVTTGLAVLVSTGWAAVTGVLGSIALSSLGYLQARHVAKISASATALAAETAAKAAIQNNSKSLLVGSVTAERSTWRKEMREAAIELTTQLRLSADRKALDRSAMYQAVSGIRLRLNPEGRDPDAAKRNRHPLDRDVHDKLDEVLNISSRAFAVQRTIANDLEKSVALLLKREWKVSKHEANTGELGGGGTE